MAQYAVGCSLCVRVCVEQSVGTERGAGRLVTTGHVHRDGLSAEELRHFLTHLASCVDRENILCSSVEHGMHRVLIT
jgi:hypothetical protein